MNTRNYDYMVKVYAHIINAAAAELVATGVGSAEGFCAKAPFGLVEGVIMTGLGRAEAVIALADALKPLVGQAGADALYRWYDATDERDWASNEEYWAAA